MIDRINAWIDGYEARLAGLSESDNPYRDEILFGGWLEGFRSTDEG